jgi:hypothetical protein
MDDPCAALAALPAPSRGDARGHDSTITLSWQGVANPDPVNWIVVYRVRRYSITLPGKPEKIDSPSIYFHAGAGVQVDIAAPSVPAELCFLGLQQNLWAILGTNRA